MNIPPPFAHHRHAWTRRSARALFTLMLALVMWLASGVPAANAHAIVLRTDPPDSATLSAAPNQVRLWFSEPVAANFTLLELMDGAGRRIPLTARIEANSEGAAEVVQGEEGPAVLAVVDLPALTPDVYRLTWRTLSSNDLHDTAGTIVFGVQRAVDAPSLPAEAPAPQPLEVALRWINLSALAALIGALAIEALMGGLLGRKLLWLAWGGALLAAVAGIGLLLAQAASISETGDQTAMSAWTIIRGTGYGGVWALRQALLIALVIAIPLAYRKGRWSLSIPDAAPTPPHAGMHSPHTAPIAPPAASPTPYMASTPPDAAVPQPHAAPTPLRAAPMAPGKGYTLRAALMALALAIVVAQALAGHATAFNAISPLRVAAAALHLLAAGIWVGGLLVLSVVVVPMLRQGPDGAALAWTALRRFGALAAGSLAALLITGLLMSGQQVASLDALLLTLYGRALLLKIGLAAGVALIGLANAATLHPRVGTLLRVLAPRRLFRTVPLEAAGAASLLLLAALLGAAPPARGPAFAPPPAEAPTPALTTRADDLVVSFSVKPNRPGRNFVTLGVFNTRRPAPAPIERVVVQLIPPDQRRDPIELTVEQSADGRYQIAGDFIDNTGDWGVVVTAERRGLVDSTATMRWDVPPPPAARYPVVISNRPLAPLLNSLAIGAAALIAGALVASRLWRLVSALTLRLPAAGRYVGLLRRRGDPS